MRGVFFSAIMAIVVLTGFGSKKQETFIHARLSYETENTRSNDPIEKQDTIPSVRFPDVTKPPEKIVQNLMIFVKANSRIYSGDRELPFATLDSTIKEEIERLRKDEFDPVTVVINADSAASYGTVYHIMRAARKQGAKIVARVE